MRRTLRLLMFLGLGTALLSLGGCAWTGEGMGAILSILALLAAACGGQALADGTAPGETGGAAGSSGAGGTGGTGETGGAAGSAGTGGTAGSSGSGGTVSTGGNAGIGGTAGGGTGGTSTLCGTGSCIDYMTCVDKAGEPWCLPDADRDGVDDSLDVCPYVSDAAQLDSDGDGVGNACDLCAEPNDQNPCGDPCCADPDGDGMPGSSPYGGMVSGQDNCPFAHNTAQLDTDQDGVGNACDLSPEVFNPMSPCGDPNLDSDGDLIPDVNYCGPGAFDTCPKTPSGTGTDTDQDGVGDTCDPDGIAPQAPGTASAARRASDRLARRTELLQRYLQCGALDSETVRLALL